MPSTAVAARAVVAVAAEAAATGAVVAEAVDSAAVVVAVGVMAAAVAAVAAAADAESPAQQDRFMHSAATAAGASSDTIRSFAKCLIQEKKSWRSNVLFPSSNPTPSRRM
jgi:hypothetical protein